MWLNGTISRILYFGDTIILSFVRNHTVGPRFNGQNTSPEGAVILNWAYLSRFSDLQRKLVERPCDVIDPTTAADLTTDSSISELISQMKDGLQIKDVRSSQLLEIFQVNWSCEMRIGLAQCFYIWQVLYHFITISWHVLITRL